MKNSMIFLQYYSWIAMLSFPISHLLQIKKILTEHHVEDISYLTFSSLIIANITSFIYVNKIQDLRIWFNFIIPAILEFITVLIIFYHRDKKRERRLFIISFIIICLIFGYSYFNYRHYLHNIAGLITAIIFPMSVIFTLHKLYLSKHPKQANHIISWYLMITGLLGMYIISEEYTDWKAIMAFLVPAILSGLVIYKLYQKKQELRYQPVN